MNNKEFIAALAMKSGFSQEESQKLTVTIVKAMAKNFEAGDSVAVTGFGTFEVKKRLERVMVNPATGQRMLVPPKLSLNFRAALSLKEKINKGGTE